MQPLEYPRRRYSGCRALCKTVRWPVREAEGRIIDRDVRGLDAFREQVSLQDLIRRARVNVVRSFKHPPLHSDFVHQVLNSGNRLLIRRRAGVDDVSRRLFSFVLHRIKEQAVVLFENREHGFSGDRRPAAKNYSDLVFLQQLMSLLGKQRPVGCRIDDHRLQFFAQQSAFLVLFVNHQKDSVLQRRLADGHGPRK